MHGPTCKHLLGKPNGVLAPALDDVPAARAREQVRLPSDARPRGGAARPPPLRAGHADERREYDALGVFGTALQQKIGIFHSSFLKMVPEIQTHRTQKSAVVPLLVIYMYVSVLTDCV